MREKPLQPLVLFTVNLFFHGETGWSDKVSKSAKLNYAIENFTGCVSVCLVGTDVLYKFQPECGQSIRKGTSRWWLSPVFWTNKTSNRFRPFRKSSHRVTGSHSSAFTLRNVSRFVSNLRLCDMNPRVKAVVLLSYLFHRTLLNRALRPPLPLRFDSVVVRTQRKRFIPYSPDTPILMRSWTPGN